MDKKLIIENLLNEFKQKINENIENQSVIDDLIITLDKICVASAKLKDTTLVELKQSETPSEFFDKVVRNEINDILYLTEEVFEEQITELDSMYNQNDLNEDLINEETEFDEKINQLSNSLDKIYDLALDSLEVDLKGISDGLMNNKPVDKHLMNLEKRIKLIDTYNKDLPVWFDDLKKLLNVIDEASITDNGELTDFDFEIDTNDLNQDELFDFLKTKYKVDDGRYVGGTSGRLYDFPFEASNDLRKHGFHFTVQKVTNKDHKDYGKKYLEVSYSKV